jgi:hypothetical protein
MTSRNSKKDNRVSEVPVSHRHEVKTLLGSGRGCFIALDLVAWNYTGWWFGTFGLFSMSYMGCHPSH